MNATKTAPLASLAALAAFACSPEAPAPIRTAAAPAAAMAADAGGDLATAPRAPVQIQILAFNDLHGYLEPPAGSSGYVLASPSDPIASLGPDAGVRTNADAGAALVPAGGAAYLATYVRRLRAQNPNTFFVSAGDLTGASPLLSNLFDDEPTVLVMNQVGLDFEGVGNHDFDRGLGELERLAHGGPDARGSSDGGTSPGTSPFPGARFQYLAANVTHDETSATVFPPYAIREAEGVKIAFIGVTLEATPSVTKAEAVKGLHFASEITTVNALVPRLKSEGVAAIVMLVHQGGFQDAGGTYDACEGFTGTLPKLILGGPDQPGLDPDVDVVASGHTHQAYNCVLGGRLVTSAASYGRIVTKIDLTIDPVARRVIEKHARNIAITHDVPQDPEVLKTIAVYKDKAAPKMNRLVGYVKSDFIRDEKVIGSPSCETPLGDLIADAQLAATRDARHGSADIAFMNPGGIRADLLARQPDRPATTITYGDAFEVQPFGNDLVTMSLTGAQIAAILRAQFKRDRPRVLQPSQGFSYVYGYDRVTRKGTIDTGSLRLRGALVDPAKTYRVTVSSFLADGGDDFDTFKEGTARMTSGRDLDALLAYLGTMSSARAPLVPHPPGRVVGSACR